MVVVMKADATDADIEAVAEKVRAARRRGVRLARHRAHHHRPGRRHRPVPGDPVQADAGRRSRDPDRQALQDGRARPAPRGHTVKVGTTPVGRDSFTIIAGPCAVESEEQAMSATRAAKAAGATILRGDIYKPRTSPYSFQGLGERGLEILGECRRDTGLPIVVEVVDVSQVEHVAEVADCIRVGTRNAQNFELLKEVGLDEQAGDAEARAGHDDRRVAAGRRVRRAARQLRDHPVRTRHPDVRAVHPQHARPGGDGGRAARVAPAGDRRSVARGGQARTWWRRWRWPRSRPAPTAS